MAVEETIEVHLSGDTNGVEAKDLTVYFPFGDQQAELRIPRAIVRSAPEEEWADAVATIRQVAAFLAAVRIPQKV